MWLCRCDCGNEICVVGHLLSRDKQQSCGCLQKEQLIERNRSHGHATKQATSPEYRSWRSMLTRCNNPRANSYEDYGGRGIKVCPEWLHFDNFLADMGKRPPGTSIERDDANGDYIPANCRWATPKEQANNKRKTRRLTHDGRSLSVQEWAERTGIPRGTIWARLRYGWEVAKILTTPPDIRRVMRFH